MEEKRAFITGVGKYLPGNPVENDEIEKHLGLIGEKCSKAKSIILRQNQIIKRHYAVDENGKLLYSNAKLTANAIKDLLEKTNTKISEVELLACGTSTPDQMLPSHASMVHGLLEEAPSFEIASLSGVCCSGAQSIVYAYQSILSGLKEKAICTGSELASPILMAKSFDAEYKILKEIESNPIIAFEKDFLRFMLSDGAGAFLLTNKPKGLSLKIEWIESISYANILPPCMFQGLDAEADGNFKSWKEMTSAEWLETSVFAIKQNTRLLGKHIVELSIAFINKCIEKHHFDVSTLSYFLPHLSSMYFRKQMQEAHFEEVTGIPEEKWFINLPYVGNVGSASIYLATEELVYSGKLKENDKILLFIPESGRFSFATILLTVVNAPKQP
ncbi:MAG: beta-ketoacyl-ACP synthase III [Tannerella sp.]|jgi:3-oxoacyl-[acyl-carrier-protein] synthase-3|nr:beta-ketoacyl-ACP synthase III [Tannerella sp.]